jgi:hypothetical protein
MGTSSDDDETLRDLERFYNEVKLAGRFEWAIAVLEARAEILELRAEVKRLRAALGPREIER